MEDEVTVVLQPNIAINVSMVPNVASNVSLSTGNDISVKMIVNSVIDMVVQR